MEAAEAGAVVLVPFGATEQHGLTCHDMDILAATAVDDARWPRRDFPVLVANVSYVGFSPE